MNKKDLEKIFYDEIGCNIASYDEEKYNALYIQWLEQKLLCDCYIRDIRNEVIGSGYMCVKCGKLYTAADH
jgi:hypothetical protein